MAKKTKAIESLHPKVGGLIERVGENIRRARKRRGYAATQLARMALVSRDTISRMEKGDPAVSIGVIASVLNVLHLEDDLSCLADPETDQLGKIMADDLLPKRVRSRKVEDYDF